MYLKASHGDKRTFRGFSSFSLAFYVQNKIRPRGKKELLLEFVDDNITSLHFSHCETNPDLGVQQKYVRVWPIFTFQSHE